MYNQVTSCYYLPFRMTAIATVCASITFRIVGDEIGRPVGTGSAEDDPLAKNADVRR